jgi:hypothetical protein
MPKIGSLIAALALAAAASGCAVTKTYETVLDVCSSGNGTVKSVKVAKSSGDAEIDRHAVEKVGPSVVYQATDTLSCRPLVVEYKVSGES